MADQSIARSFKGILRVANVQDLNVNIPDIFFEPNYYGSPKGLLAEQPDSYDTAYYALSGAMQRYSSDDPYVNNKVPVTDSLGFYMNINLGAESTTIGFDESNNGNNADKETFQQTLEPTNVEQDKVFPVFEAPTLTVGLIKKNLPSEKNTVTHGTVSLDSGNNVAQLIFNNNFDHTENNITDGTTFKEIGKPLRTIFRITNNNVQDYDVLMHNQNDYDSHNYEENGVLDSFVDVANLKTYVKERISQYVSSNVSEVPPGTVMFQYINLNKWYGLTLDEDSKNEDEGASGHRPPMGRADYVGDFKSTLYQNVSKKINQLSVMQTSGGQHLVQEVIPLYKRDYVLMDGATYTIYTVFPDATNKTDYQSFERFINLFYVLGYRYTEYSKIKTHYKNTSNRKDDGKKIYSFAGENGRLGSEAIKDKDALWCIDVGEMLAFRVLYEEFKNGRSNNGISACLNPDTMQYDRDRAEEWLKTAPIPPEFIFNSIVPPEEGGMVYPYTPAPINATDKPITYNINIGVEVSSFNSKIWYYDYEEEKFVATELWRTAEVQAALDLFAKYPGERDKELKSYCYYSFQVPSFKFDSPKYNIGGFVGSSPYYWSNEAQEVTQTQSVTTWDDSQVPHRHYVLRGLTSNPKAVAGAVLSGALMGRGEGPYAYVPNSFFFFPSCFQMSNGVSYVGVTERNYIMCDLNNTYYEQKLAGGVNAKVIQIRGITSKDDPDIRFQTGEPNRGATSPPISIAVDSDADAKYESASANSATGQAEYFSPECTLYLPLIKL